MLLVVFCRPDPVGPPFWRYRTIAPGARKSYSPILQDVEANENRKNQGKFFMFDNPAEIQRAMEQLDYRIPPPAIEQIVQLASPIVSFVTRESGSLDSTRFGGVPDLPAGVPWPRLPSPEAFGDIIPPYDGYDMSRARSRMAEGFPLAFVAQIDLARLPEQVPASALFPDSGRLLFFYDLASYDIGVWTTKIIWDKSASADLSPAAVPEELHKAHVSDYAQVVENDRFNAELDREYGDQWDPDELPEASQYLFPPQPATPIYTVVLPTQSSLEFAPLIHRSVDIDSEEMFLSDIVEEVVHHQTQETPDNLLSFTMAGPPDPEQDDPRHDAAHIEGGNAADWLLLLQVNVAGLLQRNAEGTIYFFVRKHHLKNRNFDRVVGVYQQT